MKYIKLLLFAGLCCSVSCNKPLSQEVFSQLGPSNFYKTAEDAEALLTAAYANSQGYRDLVRDQLTFGEMTTDIMIERSGAINALTQPVENFTWDASHPWLEGLWSRYYSAIYRCNIVIDKVPGITMNEDRKAQIIAEARFLRAVNYDWLYGFFGPTPLITTSDVKGTDRPKRASKEEMIKFIEDEFLAVSKILPVKASQYYRATSGAALGFLCKFYLNNKEWQNAAEIAKQIIDGGAYQLFTSGNRTDLFNLDNEENKEFIFQIPFVVKTSTDGNTYFSHAVPPNYKFKYPPKVNFAAQIKVRSAFINTFDSTDERLGAFCFTYVNTSGKPITLGTDDVRDFKYPEDPNGIGDVSGNDFPLVRYSDILLSRAEALNELQGPNQESIDLINQVRNAAGLDDLVLSDFSSKEQLRDHLLDERGWEFHCEGLRRQDLIRMGKFIDMAIARGKQAMPYQVLFPIPQPEMDRNQKLEQNPGY